MHLPTERVKLVGDFKTATGEIARGLMKRNTVDSEPGEMEPVMDKDDKSVLGLLGMYPFFILVLL